ALGGDDDVRAGLQVVADGIRGGDRVPAVPGDRGGDRAAGEVAGAAMSDPSPGLRPPSPRKRGEGPSRESPLPAARGEGGAKRRVRGVIVVHAALIIGSIVTLFPLLWMLSASFMSPGEATTFPPHVVPHAA